jgi:hypothetical protein
MSNERLDALGLPRREFLKRAAIGAFAVPAIVSFGLFGTAEAATGCFPNQTYANQAEPINELAIFVWQREEQDLVDSGLAREMRKKLFDTEAKLLDGQLKGACRTLADVRRVLARASSKRIDGNVASYLDSRVANWMSQFRCDTC